MDDRDLENASLNVGADMRKINFCFRFLKELYLQMAKMKSVPSNSQLVNSNLPPNITIVDSSHYDTKETKDLKETLRQRDNEISWLTLWSLLKKRCD